MTAKKTIVLDEAPTIELDNYSIHKQLYAQMEPLSEKDLNKKLTSIGGWFSAHMNSKYFTLMCREIYDFTTFHFHNLNYSQAVDSLKSLLESRGIIIDINYVHSEDAYECWIAPVDEDEPRMYYLFESSWMVVEID